MTDAEVLDKLVRQLPENTLQALAAKLGESTQTVSNWKNLPRGIAWPKRATVAALARELRVKLPADFETRKQIEAKAA